MIYYTYAHIKPDGEIFYIGKGSGRRAWSKESRNPHWNNIVAKYGFDAQILGEFDTEEEAFKEEIELIAHFGKFGKLCNMTGGGDNPPRLVGSKNPMFGKTGKNNHMFGKKRSEKTKQKISDANSGENNGMFGRNAEQNPYYKGSIVATNLKTGAQQELTGMKQILAAGFEPSNVYNCALGKRKSHKGHTFKRLEK